MLIDGPEGSFSLQFSILCSWPLHISYRVACLWTCWWRVVCHFSHRPRMPSLSCSVNSQPTPSPLQHPLDQGARRDHLLLQIPRVIWSVWVNLAIDLFYCPLTCCVRLVVEDMDLFDFPNMSALRTWTWCCILLHAQHMLVPGNVCWDQCCCWTCSWNNQNVTGWSETEMDTFGLDLIGQVWFEFEC